MINTAQDTLNFAFATSNQIHLDEHLGKCQSLAIYSISPNSSEHINTVYLSHDEGHNRQKIYERLTALRDCFVVYCLACGNPVRQQLLAQGTRVVVYSTTVTIEQLIAQIQANWPGKVALRQKRQLEKQQDANYLSNLEVSEW